MAEHCVLPYGLNPHMVGIVCKEMVRRAMEAILKQRRLFEMTQKDDKNGKPDFFTSADKAAQEVYVGSIAECFPGFGVVAEEDHLSLPCTIPDFDAFFTVDPLDGTNAFIRRQSHGVGTMLSLVCNGKVAAAFVGDVMTGEIYYYRPASDKVHRLFGFSQSEDLVVNPKLSLANQYVLLRELPERCGPLVQAMTKRPDAGGLFKNAEVGGGSVGVSCARLWKGEIGGLVLDAVTEAPWDYCPVWGISQKLGFVFLRLNEEREELASIVPRPSRQSTERSFELLIIHQSRVVEAHEWARCHRVCR